MSGLLFLFLRRLAGTRPGGRHPFLVAQERTQRRRAAQLWHRRTHYAPCGRCVRAAAVSQIGGARWGAGSCALTDALWPPRAASLAAQQAKHPPKKRIHQGATTQTTPTASCLARRSCLSAAPAGREASFTAQAAQHAFFADFLARARKLVARRGETRPAALKKEKKQLSTQKRRSAPKEPSSRPLRRAELLGWHAQPVGKGAAKAFFAGKAAGLGNALERHVGAQQQGAGFLPAHLVLQLL